MVKAENTTYVAYEELLEKKIKKNTWRQYWVVLRGDRLVFLSESDQKIAGVIKLTKETTCKVLRRKASKGRSRSKQPLTSTMEHVQNSEDETWKFKVYAKRGVHLLKTNCKSSCDKWTEAISCAVRNLLDYSFDITHSPSLITTGHERNNLKYRLRKNFKYAWTSMFGYVPLGEEEEEEEEESLTISALAPGFSKSRFFSSMYPPIFLTFSIHASAGPLSPRILAQVTAQNY